MLLPEFHHVKQCDLESHSSATGECSSMRDPCLIKNESYYVLKEVYNVINNVYTIKELKWSKLHIECVTTS